MDTPVSTPTTTERQSALDAARAAMMLLGLVVHTLVSYVTLPVDTWPYKDRATSEWCDLLSFGIHSFRMPVFFVLAGYFAALLLEQRGPRGFAQNRAQRVVLPLLLGLAFISPVVGFTESYLLAVQAGEARPALLALEKLLGGAHPGLGHLWFLYQLVLFCALSLLATWLVPRSWRAGALQGFGWLLQRPYKVLLLAAPMAALFSTMPGGVLDTDVSFLPSPALLASYGLFFGFGTLLWSTRALLPALQRHSSAHLLLGLSLIPLNVWCITVMDQDGSFDTSPLRPVSASLGALLSWAFTFGWLGFFQRHFQQPRGWVRYLADASYWMYLVHLPFTLWFPSWFAQPAWPVAAKAAAVLGLTLCASLGSYVLFVRSTWLGALLNGRRQPRLSRPGLTERRSVASA